ncbi:MAG: hypothetical protein PHE67_05785, partial [Campylobacterales bacterium]|nr:hypothetical protein [Campylobacterales bacterium]
TVDPKGISCRTFDANYTTDGVTKTICLPWWRIEREYQMSASTCNDLAGFLKTIPINYPPKTVNVCKTWDTMEYQEGGQVTCTSYYSRVKSAECYDNPNQAICFKDNCSQNVKTNCTLKSVVQGEVTNLTNAFANQYSGKPEARDGKMDVKTYQYECPSGYLPQQRCLERKSALMYPFECKAPSYAGARDGEYVYCNKNAPIYDDTGEIAAFPGKCSDGRDINCTVNSFNTTSTKCIEPVKESYEEISSLKQEDTRKYNDYTIDVLAGQDDIYAANPLCLRMNTVRDATEYNSTNPNWEAYKIVTHETGNCGGISYTNCTNCAINYEQCDFDLQPGGGSCGVDVTTGQPKFYNYQAHNGTTYVVGAQIDEDTYRFSSNSSTLSAALSDLGKDGSPAYCDIYKIHRACDVGDTFNGITCIRKYEKRKYRCYDDFPDNTPPPTCSKIDETLAQPVTDWTNKTVFIKRVTNFECSAIKERQIGCNKYEVINNKGQLSFVTDVSYESKDYSGQFTQALATAQMLEQMQHLWSGWAGECEYGTFTDFSFLQDPMFWASVVMSLYGGAMKGSLGTTAQQSVGSLTQSVGESMMDVGSSVGSDSLVQAGGYTTVDGANAVNGTYETTYGTTKIVMTAAGILAPLVAPATDAEKSTAFNYQQAWMGGDTEDPAALNYSSCMASIGLSYANMISYQAGADENTTASILYHPWNNPLRISNQDYLGLQAILGGAIGDATYMTNNYKMVSQDAIGVTLIARNMTSYEYLGQVMCAGYRVSGTISQNAQTAVTQATGGSSGNKGAAVAANAAIAAIGMINPIAGLVAMVAYKFISSFSSGDACTDEQFAMGRSKIQWKTNKFQKFGQCHFVKEECSKKMFMKGCITHKKHFCCYDQITTRVFVEGAKEELGRGWDNCNDIYISDLKNIGFRQCGPNENPTTDKCLSAAKYAELRQVIMRQVSKGIVADSIEQQVKNSMALPK